jgi:hypothetical protein
LEGTTQVIESGLSAEEKQELQAFLLGITDKGKGVEEPRDEERGREERRGEQRVILEELSGIRSGARSLNEEAGRDERERAELIRKVGELGESEERGRKRIREEDLPWFESIRSSRSRLTEEMLKSRKLLQDYREDIDMVAQSIQAAPNGPVNFPATEWKNILRGRPVNLNTVYASIHTFKPVPESIGRLGPFEIRSESGESTKHIETAAQWISAWDETAQATEVAFPHRGAELRDYGRTIRRLFDCVAANYHKRVFLYDEAVRGSVRGGETLSLNDDNAFRHLHTAYILPIGSEVQTGIRRSGRIGFEQVCRGFNGKGCAIRNCRYRHICGICSDAQHGGVDCPKRKLGNDSKA